MIRVFDDLESLSLVAAQQIISAASEAIAKNERFSLALSGGSTPRRLYEILATSPFRDQIQWQKVHVFWGDERCVPMTDPRSNYRMAREALLDSIPLPTNNIHPIPCNLHPADAAAAYEAQLQNFFDGKAPFFDLILLGLGDNAHTASLFPHTPVLDETQYWVVPVFIPELEMYRVTLTVPFINQTRQVVFLVSGRDKAQALYNVLEGAYHPHEFPAQLIHPNDEHPLWLVDRAAGHKLTGTIDGKS